MNITSFNPFSSIRRSLKKDSDRSSSNESKLNANHTVHRPMYGSGSLRQHHINIGKRESNLHFELRNEPLQNFEFINKQIKIDHKRLEETTRNESQIQEQQKQQQQLQQLQQQQRQLPARSSSVKRLPFSIIKTNNSNNNVNLEAELPPSPKLLDDNFFLYSNNKKNFNNHLHGSTSPSTSNNYIFTRSTLKASSFHTYKRSFRYLDII